LSYYYKGTVAELENIGKCIWRFKYTTVSAGLNKKNSVWFYIIFNFTRIISPGIGQTDYVNSYNMQTTMHRFQNKINYNRFR